VVFIVEHSDELIIISDGFLGDPRSFSGDSVGVCTVKSSDELVISLDEACPVKFFATGFSVPVIDFIAVTTFGSFVA